MKDPVIRSLEMAMTYLQGAILCRMVNDLGPDDVNLFRASTEIEQAVHHLELIENDYERDVRDSSSENS